MLTLRPFSKFDWMGFNETYIIEAIAALGPENTSVALQALGFQNPGSGGPYTVKAAVIGYEVVDGAPYRAR